jgi:cell division septum initiation protein DivIVA
MPDAIAPVPISDETTRRLFGEPAFRVAKRGGYDPGDVAEFLSGLGSQMVTLIGRLRKAESDVEVMKTEVGHWQARTRDAEATRETFERTLALAEDTANAAIADARHRAAGIMTKAEANADELIGQARHESFHMVEQAREEAQRCYADERMKVREEWQRVQDESAQLETLRLAVAAETMALEEVRNQLRTRIRLAATEMLKVAESPDCLGTPIARGMPERPKAAVARPAPAEIAETSVVAASAVVPVAIAVAAEAIERSEAVVPTVSLGEVDVTPPAIEPIGVNEGITAPEPVAAEPVAAEIPELDSIGVSEGLGNPEADAAFERFMSEDIEDEPSREWILAG